MKKLFTTVILLGTLISTNLQAFSIQIQKSQIEHQMQSSGSKTKIYSSTGSLLEYRETQNNGTVKTYNRYHQATGMYKSDGGKIKYKAKK